MLGADFPKASHVVTPETITAARQVVREVYMDEKIERYIVDIVFDHPRTRLLRPRPAGADDRLRLLAARSISLRWPAAKAYAFIKRRGYVIPEDVRAVCPDVMRQPHRLTYEAEAENVTARISSPKSSIPSRYRSPFVNGRPPSHEGKRERGEQYWPKSARIEIKTRGLSNDIFAGKYHSCFQRARYGLQRGARLPHRRTMCATSTGTSPPATTKPISRSTRRSAN